LLIAKFQLDLQSCLARYKATYKELSKIGSQRSIIEFAFEIKKHVPETVSHSQLPMNAVRDNIVQKILLMKVISNPHSTKESGYFQKLATNEKSTLK
jgi:hypothetical protein